MSPSNTICAPFDTSAETFEEFLQRFTVQASDQLTAAGNDGRKKATALIKALPVAIITDLQRRIKPQKLSEADYDTIVTKLTSQFEVKKSIIGASVKFINRKQAPGESIEIYAKSLNNLAA